MSTIRDDRFAKQKQKWSFVSVLLYYKDWPKGASPQEVPTLNQVWHPRNQHQVEASPVWPCTKFTTLDAYMCKDPNKTLWMKQFFGHVVAMNLVQTRLPAQLRQPCCPRTVSSRSHQSLPAFQHQKEDSLSATPDVKATSSKTRMEPSTLMVYCSVPRSQSCRITGTHSGCLLRQFSEWSSSSGIWLQWNYVLRGTQQHWCQQPASQSSCTNHLGPDCSSNLSTHLAGQFSNPRRRICVLPSLR